MEILSLLLELIDVVEIGLVVVDVFAWIFSRPNRRERRAAKRAGKPLPRRSGWNKVFMVVSMLLVALLLPVILFW